MSWPTYKEMEDRFWRERPQVIMWNSAEDKAESCLADERAWIEREFEKLRVSREPK